MKNFTGIPVTPINQANISTRMMQACPLPNTQFADVIADINWDVVSSSFNQYFGQLITLNASSAGAATQPINRILSIYIDNLDVAFGVHVFFEDTGHTVYCPPHTTKWTRVLTNQLTAKVFGSAVGISLSQSIIGITRVHFLNSVENPFDTKQDSIDPVTLLTTFSVTGITANTTINWGLWPTTYTGKKNPLYLTQIVYTVINFNGPAGGSSMATFALVLQSGFQYTIYSQRTLVQANGFVFNEPPLIVPLGFYVDPTWTNLQAQWNFTLTFPAGFSADCLVYGTAINSP